MTTEEIKQAFRNHYKDRFNDVGLFEFGISDGHYFNRCQFDAYMIAPHIKIMKGFEFKISRTDFLSDLRLRPKRYWSQEPKWKTYLKYCNLFYWVCPEDIIKPEEVESPAGLLWITTEGYFRLKRRPKKNPGLDFNLMQRILFLFAARTKTRVGDYF